MMVKCSEMMILTVKQPNSIAIDKLFASLRGNKTVKKLVIAKVAKWNITHTSIKLTVFVELQALFDIGYTL